MNKLVTRILDELVDQIEAGVVPWKKSWRTGLPHNQVTLRSYHGVNVLMLWVEMINKGYSTNGWATEKQWNSIGATVKEEHKRKGTPVIFYKVMNEDDDERRYSFMRCSWAFNVDQVDGYDVPAYDVEYRPDLEEFVSSLGIPIKQGGGEPSYAYMADYINMPLITAFGKEDDYYVTLFHEIAHATGHKSRLDRPLVPMGKPGTEQHQLYAAEELTAELCAAFTGAHFKLDQDQHASYLASWLKAWPKDKRGAALYFAAKHAGKAYDWIIEHGSLKQDVFLEAAE